VFEWILFSRLSQRHSQFVEFPLHLEKLALEHRSQNGHTALFATGHIQHSVDLGLVFTQMWILAEKPFPRRQGLLQPLIFNGCPLLTRLSRTADMILHAVSNFLCCQWLPNVIHKWPI